MSKIFFHNILLATTLFVGSENVCAMREDGDLGDLWGPKPAVRIIRKGPYVIDEETAKELTRIIDTGNSAILAVDGDIEGVSGNIRIGSGSNGYIEIQCREIFKCGRLKLNANNISVMGVTISVDDENIAADGNLSMMRGGMEDSRSIPAGLGNLEINAGDIIFFSTAKNNFM